MSITVPHMGLRLWNLGQDPYNSQQLADNFGKIDQHDHSPGRGRQLGTGALQDGSVTAAKLAPDSVGATNVIDGSVTTPKLADHAVTTIKVADNAITLTQLGSDVVTDYGHAFGTYKLVRDGFNAIAAAATVTGSGTYLFVPGATTPFLASNASAYGGIFYFDPADWTAGSRTTYLRLRGAYVTNGTQSGQTATLGLYPVSSVSGGAVTVGTVVTGSTVPFANPAINTLGQADSGDFAAPVAGYYAIGFAVGGAFTASSAASVRAALQMRQV